MVFVRCWHHGDFACNQVKSCYLVTGRHDIVICKWTAFVILWVGYDARESDYLTLWCPLYEYLMVHTSMPACDRLKWQGFATVWIPYCTHGCWTSWRFATIYFHANKLNDVLPYFAYDIVFVPLISWHHVCHIVYYLPVVSWIFCVQQERCLFPSDLSSHSCVCRSVHRYARGWWHDRSRYLHTRQWHAGRVPILCCIMSAETVVLFLALILSRINFISHGSFVRHVILM